MTEPQRSDHHADQAPLAERDHEARVEELLLTGLDHYFAGQYELAVNVWTRVLFLDRGHARARAYIERARSAISERQREGEELLHSGAAAFHRGDPGAARRLLASAMERGAASDEAFSLLDRIDRLEAAQPTNGPAEDRQAAAALRPTPATAVEGGRSRVAWIAAGLVTGVALASVAGAYVWTHRSGWLSITDTTAPVSAVRPAEDEPLPLPAPSEVWLARARALHAKGRLHEALQALEPIRAGDPLRAEAAQERATIQTELIAAARGGGAPRQQGPPPRR